MSDCPRYIRNHWNWKRPPHLKRGDYVVATKYADGDPGDHFAVGYYRDSYDHYGTERFIVVDESGAPFRANGFRRVKQISAARGNWIVAHLDYIERLKNRYSVWHWVRAPWKELNGISP